MIGRDGGRKKERGGLERKSVRERNSCRKGEMVGGFSESLTCSIGIT